MWVFFGGGVHQYSAAVRRGCKDKRGQLDGLMAGLMASQGEIEVVGDDQTERADTEISNKLHKHDQM